MAQAAEGGVRREGAARPARRPAWLRKDRRVTPEVLAVKACIAGLGLHTVCESAGCPNLGECFACGTVTFMILGSSCSRGCLFCGVPTGHPGPPDPAEGPRIAEYLAQAGLRYAVLTSVTRDDLPDGGARHFASVVLAIRARLPRCGIELLVPDFGGSQEAIDIASSLPVEVLGHNLETVPRLYPEARPGACYARSLELLRRAKERWGRTTKTGLMVGLGETAAELVEVLEDIRDAGTDILTLGQYLRPSRACIPVRRHYHPSEFEELRRQALACGIKVVFAGPYVRSSYRAAEAHEILKGKKDV